MCVFECVYTFIGAVVFAVLVFSKRTKIFSLESIQLCVNLISSKRHKFLVPFTEVINVYNNLPDRQVYLVTYKKEIIFGISTIS